MIKGLDKNVKTVYFIASEDVCVVIGRGNLAPTINMLCDSVCVIIGRGNLAPTINIL